MDGLRRIGEILALTPEETIDLLRLQGEVAETAAETRARVNRVLEITELLERKLRPETLPAVFRRPAAAYGGSSLIEMIRAGREAEALAAVQRSLDWSGTA